MTDTRVITARDDAKAGAEALDSGNPAAARAAFDDGRCKLHELLAEPSTFSARDRESIDTAFTLLTDAMELTGDAANGYALMVADAATGLLTRVADRWAA